MNDNIDIIEVKVVQNYTLFIRFEDGKMGEVDIKKIVPFKGVFAPLKDKIFFSQVFINSEVGTICWKNGADIAPSYLYENLTTS